MGLRIRKSVSIGKGARVNFSKSGVGFSLGTKGARITKRSRGGWSGSVGIPGTGVYFTKSLGSSRRSSGGGFMSGLFSVFYSLFYLSWLLVKWSFLGIFYLFKYTIIAIGWCVDKLIQGAKALYLYILELYEQHKKARD